MGKADFCTIDKTISEAFEDGKKIVILRIENEGSDGLLHTGVSVDQ